MLQFTTYLSGKLPEMKLFNDILKEKTAEGRLYSQGRVYLLISIVAYYLTLGVITYKEMYPKTEIDLESTKIIIDALQWAMALFAGYVFGGKGIEVAKMVFNRTTPPPPGGPGPAPVPAPAPEPGEIPANKKFTDPEI